jgi:hypothetical protein
VSRTVEAGRETEEKTPRPVRVCKFVVVVHTLVGGKVVLVCWTVSFLSFWWLVVVAITD